VITRQDTRSPYFGWAARAPAKLVHLPPPACPAKQLIAAGAAG